MKLNDVLSEIRTRVDKDSLTDSCSGEGCDVDMTDIPDERVIILVEHEFELREMEGRRCDRLLFFTVDNILFIVPIELKSGNIRASRGTRQLLGGVKLANHLVPEANDFETICLPVLFSGNVIHPEQHKRLNQRSGTFRNQFFKVRTARCGKERSLADALFGAIPKTQQEVLEERTRIRDVVLGGLSN